jgi:hypothetical protein
MQLIAHDLRRPACLALGYAPHGVDQMIIPRIRNGCNERNTVGKYLIDIGIDTQKSKIATYYVA